MSTDSPLFKMPATPTMPLFALSPERINSAKLPPSQQGYIVPQSPSLPEFGKPAFEIPLSKSVASSSPTRHGRGSEATVQGMVARFDSLNIKDYKQREEVVMKRLEMSRELAEMETNKLKEAFGNQEMEMKRYREEAKKLKKELEEVKDRERRAVKTVEVARDEAARVKATHEHAVGIYEKEIRRARKEAFKSSSSMVKIQEELKATRNSANILKQGLDLEKAKSQRYEQEAFSSQYKLVGMQEEFTKVQERLKLIEEERDSLKTALKEEEVARIAAEGRIALPEADDDDDDLLASPMKSPRKPFLTSNSEDKENIAPGRAKLELKSLHEELAVQQRRAQRAEEQIDFMKMECQFQCCSCRVAESQGHRYVHDARFAKEIEEMRTDLPIDTEADIDMRDCGVEPEIIAQAQPQPQTSKRVSLRKQKRDTKRKSEFLISFSSPVKAVIDAPSTPVSEKDQTGGSRFELVEGEAILEDDDLPESDPSVIIRPSRHPQDDSLDQSEDIMSSPPRTPQSESMHFAAETPAFEMITHTTTIPITFTPAAKDPHDFPRSRATDLRTAHSSFDLQQTPKPSIPSTPATLAHPPVLSAGLPSPFVTSGAFKADGTLDREAALEQIRLRRGRARSVVLGHVTPKKPTVEGLAGRRDISAPTIRGWTKG